MVTVMILFGWDWRFNELFVFKLASSLVMSNCRTGEALILQFTVWHKGRTKTKINKFRYWSDIEHILPTALFILCLNYPLKMKLISVLFNFYEV